MTIPIARVLEDEKPIMKGAVLYGPHDVRYDPRIVEPTDAIIRMSATCVCGSDLWPYRGIEVPNGPTPMGHEYCGIVEEVGRDVRKVKRGQLVVGSFFASDNSCPICKDGYQSRCGGHAGVDDAVDPRHSPAIKTLLTP